MSIAIRHVSIRVPWHDRGWDGHVCDAPLANSSCLALKLVAENRNDLLEADHAGEPFGDLSYEQTPPCIKASAAFLAGRNHTFRSVMAYSRWSDAHAHMLPATLHLPAYGAQVIPYRWMLRGSGFEIAEELELPATLEREPTEPDFLTRTSWIQHHDSQRAMLDAFAAPLIEGRSLVLFYATRTPLADDDRRVLLGAAMLEKKHGIVEYDYKPGPSGRLRAMAWERAIQHSLRPTRQEDGSIRHHGGFLMPYHRLLAAAQESAAFDPADYVAFAPEDARQQFSYGSDHVGHGPAAAALAAARAALERTSKVLPGPWSEAIDWIDAQTAELWKLRGPAPGLGVVLSALHKGFNGTLFALALSDRLAAGEDPWPKVDVVLSGREAAPPGSPAVTTALKRRWERVRGDALRHDALRLLARVELTKGQAARVWAALDPAAFVDNPYSLYEGDRGAEEPVAFEAVDRAVLPGREIAEGHALPASCPSDLSEPDGWRRLRAACVHVLETAADEGHTLLSSERLAEATAALTLSRPLPLDGEYADLFRDDFGPVVDVGEGGRPTVQLERYVSYRSLLERAVEDRLASVVAAAADWAGALERKFGPVAPADELERAARREKVVALQRLAASRVACLVGPAGTGKTAVLELLVNRPEIVGRRVLLLAPTGKARVRLGNETGRPGQAQTIAQFLLPIGRFDPDANRYAPAELAGVEASCCVIDEASMLTEDMLAAVVDALPTSCRIVLVGDPAQLPPIGAGCPFVDLLAHLGRAQPERVAELTISRRQRGDRSDARLAALFSGRPLSPGEDEIAALALEGFGDGHLRLRRWEAAGDLPALLAEVFEAEFGGQAGVVAGLEEALGAGWNGDYLNFDAGCGEAVESWQVLTVNRAQAAGSTYLNRHVKERYRGERLRAAIESNEVDPRRRWFRTVAPQGPDLITYGDKVICVRNHRRIPWVHGIGLSEEKEFVANGEMGLVTGARKKGVGKPRHVRVEFGERADRNFSFGRSAFRDDGRPYLELAYAVTVHKAQGSQFGVVVLVLPAHSRLASREMVYTALTRQKERVWILHQGGFENVLANRHEAFSAVGSRSTNLLRSSSLASIPPPLGLPAGAVRNARGFLEERLTHRTTRGEMVSSKSELVIANILHGLEKQGRLKYAVEPPLPFSDTPWGRWADFKVEARGRVWFWEHCGMLSSPAYLERWRKKLMLYADNGFMLWSRSAPLNRLIVTEDDAAGGLDSRLVDEVAKAILA